MACHIVTDLAIPILAFLKTIKSLLIHESQLFIDTHNRHITKNKSNNNMILYGINLCVYIYVYIYIYDMHMYMSGGQNYLLLAMDMAKVGGPLSAVKVCISIFSGIGKWVVPCRL